MKKEDIEFLNELKNEMLSQDKNYGVNTCFWAVMQEVKDYSYSIPHKGEEDGVEIIKDGEKVCDGNLKSISEWLKKFLEDNDIEINNYIYDEYNNVIKIDRIKFDGYCNIIEDAEDLLHYLEEEFGYEDYEIATYKIRKEIVPDILFLTKNSCEKFLQAYGYRYNNPNPCAIRWGENAQIKKLFNIIKNTDWDKEINIENLKEAYLIPMKDGGIKDIKTDDYCEEKGCETCDYGSKYIREFEIILDKYDFIVKLSDMYEAPYSYDELMKLFTSNIDKIENMTQGEFMQFVKTEMIKVCKEKEYRYEPKITIIKENKE